MTKKLLWIIFAGILLGYTGSGAALTRIKLGVATKPGAAPNIVAEKFKELIEQGSEGDISVQVFHSKSIGNETEILQQLQTNTVQMGIITAGAFDAFDPIVRVLNYPFLFKDNEQVDRILDGPLGSKILKSLERAEFKGLSFSENGFVDLTNNKRSIKTPDDLRGLKIRVEASALHKTIWRAWGANPVTMPWPIFSELEQGVIDGQESPLWVIGAYKFYEIQKYLTLTRHIYSPHIDVASLKWWKTLDAKTKDLIQKTIYEAAVFQRHDNRSKNDARLSFFKEKGMQIEVHPDIDAFRAKVAGLIDTDLYSEPRVKAMLIEMINATQ
ncbi:MAG: DctP family TRAP transporter solute-binding subunit [Desulfobacterales bacterium]